MLLSNLRCGYRLMVRQEFKYMGNILGANAWYVTSRYTLNGWTVGKELLVKSSGLGKVANQMVHLTLEV